MTELAEHLGLDLAAGEAERIAALYSQESNRAAHRRAAATAGAGRSGSRHAGNTQIYDPASLLHWNHMRQKDAASWRVAATPRQKEVLHRLCGRWLESARLLAGGLAPESMESLPG